MSAIEATRAWGIESDDGVLEPTAHFDEFQRSLLRCGEKSVPVRIVRESDWTKHEAELARLVDLAGDYLGTDPEYRNGPNLGVIEAALEYAAKIKSERTRLMAVVEVAHEMSTESDGGYGNMTTALLREMKPDSTWEARVKKLILAQRDLDNGRALSALEEPK